MNTQKGNKFKLLFYLITLISFIGQGQSKSSKFEKTMRFKDNNAEKVFVLVNINGNIAIKGHQSSEVKITALKKNLDDRSIDDLSVGTLEKGDTIIVYVKGKCLKFGYNDCSDSNINYGWNYNWNNCDGCNKCYGNYRFDFQVTLPQSTHLAASTINKGQVDIQNMIGPITARNINGGINLAGVSNETHVNTINGDIDITYAKNPSASSSYYSLNGDINANFNKNFSAEVTFKSFNGELFTNIQDVAMMPNEIAKTTGNQGLNFKIEEKKKLKFRSGGTLLDFETFNGDVYIKE